MSNNYFRACVIPKDELALALSDMDASLREKVGIEKMSPEELAVLLADVARAGKLLKELGIRGGYYVKEYHGRTYVIVNGHAGLRAYLTGTRYLAENPKVVRLGVGPIAAREAVRFNLVLALTLYTALDVAEYIASDDIALEELTGNLIYDGAGAALSIVAGGVASAVVGTYVTMALPAIGAGLVAGFVVSYFMSTLNEELGITRVLGKAIRATADAFLKGIVSSEEEVHDAHEGIGPIDIDPDEREKDIEDPLDDEGVIDIDRGERDMDHGGWGGDDFGEGPDHGGDDLEGRGSGGDVQIGEDTWTFTPIDPETGEPLGPTEVYEVGEEGKIEGDRRDDDDDDAPVGPSG